MAIDPTEWLRSLPWSHIALVLSVALNLCLLIALPFRRAINRIIANVYRAWCERQDRRSQILRELYLKMDAVNHDYLFAIVVAELSHGAAAGPERQSLLDRQHALLPRLEAVQAFLAQHELDLPTDVRQLVEKLRMEMILPAGQSAADSGAILRHSEAVTRLTRAVKGAITRHVHAGPWSGLRLGRRTAP
jgi:hypothetical protein